MEGKILHPELTIENKDIAKLVADSVFSLKKKKNTA
jgi:hypothetical protein